MGDILGGLASVLEQAAPTAASLLGGPLAGTAVGWLETQLGVTPAPGAPTDQRVAAVTQQIQAATPDQIIAMRKADDDLKAKYIDAGVLLEQSDAQDRESARARSIAQKDSFPAYLMVLLTAGFFGLLVYLASHEVPSGSRDLLNIMLGALASAWTGGVAYFYGSSKGSDRATELLAKSSPAP